MKKNMKTTFCLLTAFAMAFSFMACGGGGGGSDAVTYGGNSDPAVADTTTTVPLAQSGLRAVTGLFPTVQVLFPGGEEAAPAAASLSAEPLAEYFYTNVAVAIPSDAVIDGIDFGGEGTVQLAGTLTLELYSTSAVANTWMIDGAEMAGQFIFDGYSNETGGWTVTGTMDVSLGYLEFSNPEAEFYMDNPSLDNVGYPMFSYIEYTFDSLTVADGEDSYQVGDADLVLEMGEGILLTVNKATVSGDGEEYKIVDTTLEVASADGDTIYIYGLDEAFFGTIYDFTHGWIYFNAEISEASSEMDWVYGTIELSTDGETTDATIYLDYDEELDSYYNAFIGAVEIGRGWWVDWELIPDAGAPTIVLPDP
jgi:hypothetical protein